MKFKSSIVNQNVDKNEFASLVEQTLSAFKCKVEPVSPKVVKVIPDNPSSFHNVNSIIGALKSISKSISVFNDHLVVKQ